MKTSKVGKAKEKVVLKPIVLPGEDDFNVPPEEFNSYVSLIYGESSIGKTSLLSQFPNAITIMLEPRRRGLRMRMIEIPFVPIKKMKANKETAWSVLRRTVDAMLEDDSVSTICIDNVDRAYELCSNHICHPKGVNHPGQLNDFGTTWAIVREEFADCFDKVIYSEKSLVFSSKFSYKEVEKHDGTKFERLQPSCSAQCLKYLTECTDFIIYFTKEKKKRAFVLRSDIDVLTKVGPEDRFLDTEGRPIEILEAGESSEKAYQTLLDGFNNEREDMLRQRAEKVSVAKPKKKVV